MYLIANDVGSAYLLCCWFCGCNIMSSCYTMSCAVACSGLSKGYVIAVSMDRDVLSDVLCGACDWI